MTDDELFILGIDEAGRGPVIGPMVIVGVVATPNQIGIINKHVKKDSKGYTPLKRATLYEYIVNTAKDILVNKVSPAEIDEWVISRGGLNEMEAYYTSRIILDASSRYRLGVIYVDACDAQAENYKNRIMKYLPDEIRDINIVSEHKADEKYTIVSAASIVAKTIRDRIIEELRDKYGDFGSGYPSDPKTKRFIETTNNIEALSIVRKSWKPIRKLIEKRSVKDLGDYIGDNR